MGALAVLLCYLTVAATYVSDVDQGKIRGLIVDRSGDILTVKTAEGKFTVVVLDETKAQKPKGRSVRRVVAPGAMGTANPAATNETAQGRAANRRVEVKVLVNRGLASASKETQ